MKLRRYIILISCSLFILFPNSSYSEEETFEYSEYTVTDVHGAGEQLEAQYENTATETYTEVIQYFTPAPRVNQVSRRFTNKSSSKIKISLNNGIDISFGSDFNINEKNQLQSDFSKNQSQNATSGNKKSKIHISIKNFGSDMESKPNEYGEFVEKTNYQKPKISIRLTDPGEQYSNSDFFSSGSQSGKIRISLSGSYSKANQWQSSMDGDQTIQSDGNVESSSYRIKTAKVKKVKSVKGSQMDNAETNSVDDSMGANNGNLNGNSGDNSVGYGQLSDDLLMETIQDIIKQQDGTGNAKKHLQQQNSFDGNQKIKTSNRPIKIQIDGDGQQVKARKQNVIVQKRTDGGEEVNYYYYDQTIPKQKIKISLGDSSSKSSYQNGMEYELDLGQNGKNVKRKNQNEPQNVNIYETTSDQNVGTGFHFKKIYLGGPMEDNVEISTSETVVISEGTGQQKTMTKKKKKKKLITIELESSDEEDDEDDLAALQRYRNMKIKEKNNLYGIKKTGGRKVKQEFDNEDQTSTQSQSTNTEDQYTDSQITEKVKRKKVKSSTNDYKDEMDRRKIEMELNGNDKEYYPSMDRTSQMLEAETKKVNKQGSIDQSYMETDYYYDSKTKKKSKVKSSKSTAQSVQWYKLTQTSRKPESATAAYQSTMTMGMSTNYKAKQQDVDEYYYTEVDTEFEKKKKIKVKKSRTAKTTLEVATKMPEKTMEIVKITQATVKPGDQVTTQQAYAEVQSTAKPSYGAASVTENPTTAAKLIDKTSGITVQGSEQPSLLEKQIKTVIKQLLKPVANISTMDDYSDVEYEYEYEIVTNMGVPSKRKIKKKVKKPKPKAKISNVFQQATKIQSETYVGTTIVSPKMPLTVQGREQPLIIGKQKKVVKQKIKTVANISAIDDYSDVEYEYEYETIMNMGIPSKNKIKKKVKKSKSNQTVDIKTSTLSLEVMKSTPVKSGAYLGATIGSPTDIEYEYEYATIMNMGIPSKNKIKQKVKKSKSNQTVDIKTSTLSSEVMKSTPVKSEAYLGATIGSPTDIEYEYEYDYEIFMDMGIPSKRKIKKKVKKSKSKQTVSIKTSTVSSEVTQSTPIKSGAYVGVTIGSPTEVEYEYEYDYEIFMNQGIPSKRKIKKKVRKPKPKQIGSIKSTTASSEVTKSTPIKTEAYVFTTIRSPKTPATGQESERPLIIGKQKKSVVKQQVKPVANISIVGDTTDVEYEYDYEIVMNMGIPSKKKTKKKVKKPKSKQTGYIKLATGSLEVMETTPLKSGAYIGTTVGSAKTPITAQEMEVKYEYEYETVTELGVPSKTKLKKIAKRLKSKQIGGIEKSSVPSEVTKGTMIKSEGYVGTTIGSPKAPITVNESKEPLILGKQKKSVIKPQVKPVANISTVNDTTDVEYEYDYEIVMNMGIPSKKKTKRKVKKPKSKQTGYIKLATGSLEVVKTTPVKSEGYVSTTIGSPKTPVTVQETEVKYEYEYETATDTSVSSKTKIKKIAKRMKSKRIGGTEKSSVPSEVPRSTLIKTESYVSMTTGSPKTPVTVIGSKQPLILGKQKKSVMKPEVKPVANISMVGDTTDVEYEYDYEIVMNMGIPSKKKSKKKVIKPKSKQTGYIKLATGSLEVTKTTPVKSEGYVGTTVGSAKTPITVQGSEVEYEYEYGTVTDIGVPSKRRTKKMTKKQKSKQIGGIEKSYVPSEVAKSTLTKSVGTTIGSPKTPVTIQGSKQPLIIGKLKKSVIKQQLKPAANISMVDDTTDVEYEYDYEIVMNMGIPSKKKTKRKVKKLKSKQTGHFKLATGSLEVMKTTPVKSGAYVGITVGSPKTPITVQGSEVEYEYEYATVTDMGVPSKTKTKKIAKKPKSKQIDGIENSSVPSKVAKSTPIISEAYISTTIRSSKAPITVQGSKQPLIIGKQKKSVIKQQVKPAANISMVDDTTDVEYEYDYEIVMNMGIPSKTKTKRKVKKSKSKQTGHIKLATGSLEVMKTTPVKSGAYVGTTVGSPKTPITAQETEIKYEYEYETVTDMGVPSKTKTKKIAKRMKSKQILGMEKSTVPLEVTKSTPTKKEEDANIVQAVVTAKVIAPVTKLASTPISILTSSAPEKFAQTVKVSQRASIIKLGKATAQSKRIILRTGTSSSRTRTAGTSAKVGIDQQVKKVSSTVTLSELKLASPPEFLPEALQNTTTRGNERQATVSVAKGALIRISQKPGESLPHKSTKAAIEGISTPKATQRLTGKFVAGTKITQTIKLGKKVQGTLHPVNVPSISLEATQTPLNGTSGGVQGHKTKLSVKKTTSPTKDITQKLAVSMKSVSQADFKMNKSTEAIIAATESVLKSTVTPEKLAQSVKASKRASIIKVGKTTAQPKKIILGTGKASSKTLKIAGTTEALVDGMKTTQMQEKLQQSTINVEKGALIRISQKPSESQLLTATKPTSEGQTTTKSSRKAIQRLTGKFVAGTKATQTIKLGKKIMASQNSANFSQISLQATQNPLNATSKFVLGHKTKLSLKKTTSPTKDITQKMAVSMKLASQPYVEINESTKTIIAATESTVKLTTTTEPFAQSVKASKQASIIKLKLRKYTAQPKKIVLGTGKASSKTFKIAGTSEVLVDGMKTTQMQEKPQQSTINVEKGALIRISQKPNESQLINATKPTSEGQTTSKSSMKVIQRLTGKLVAGTKITQTIKLGKKVQGTLHPANLPSISLEATQTPLNSTSGGVQSRKTKLSLKKTTSPTKDITQKLAVSMKSVSQADFKINKSTEAIIAATESILKSTATPDKLAQSVKASKRASIIKVGKTTAQPKKIILGTGKASSKTLKMAETSAKVSIEQQSQKPSSAVTLSDVKSVSASGVELATSKTAQVQGQPQPTVSLAKGALIRISQKPNESPILNGTKLGILGSTTPKSSPKAIQRLTGKFIGGAKSTQTIKLGKKVQGTVHLANISKISLQTTQISLNSTSGIQGYETKPTEPIIAGAGSIVKSTTAPGKLGQNIKVSKRASIIKVGKTTDQPKKIILGTGKTSSKTMKLAGTTAPFAINQQSQRPASAVTLSDVKPVSASGVELATSKTAQVQGQSQPTVSLAKGALIRISQKPNESPILNGTKLDILGSTTPKSSPKAIQRLTGKFIGGAKSTQTIKLGKKVQGTLHSANVSPISLQTAQIPLNGTSSVHHYETKSTEHIIAGVGSIAKSTTAPGKLGQNIKVSKRASIIKVGKTTDQPKKIILGTWKTSSKTMKLAGTAAPFAINQQSQKPASAVTLSEVKLVSTTEIPQEGLKTTQNQEKLQQATVNVEKGALIRISQKPSESQLINGTKPTMEGHTTSKSSLKAIQRLTGKLVAGGKVTQTIKLGKKVQASQHPLNISQISLQTTQSLVNGTSRGVQGHKTKLSLEKVTSISKDITQKLEASMKLVSQSNVQKSQSTQAIIAATESAVKSSGMSEKVTQSVKASKQASIIKLGKNTAQPKKIILGTGKSSSRTKKSSGITAPVNINLLSEMPASAVTSQDLKRASVSEVPLEGLKTATTQEKLQQATVSVDKRNSQKPRESQFINGREVTLEGRIPSKSSTKAIQRLTGKFIMGAKVTQTIKLGKKVQGTLHPVNISQMSFQATQTIINGTIGGVRDHKTKLSLKKTTSPTNDITQKSSVSIKLASQPYININKSTEAIIAVTESTAKSSTTPEKIVQNTKVSQRASIIKLGKTTAQPKKIIIGIGKSSSKTKKITGVTASASINQQSPPSGVTVSDIKLTSASEVSKGGLKSVTTQEKSQQATVSIEKGALIRISQKPLESLPVQSTKEAIEGISTPKAIQKLTGKFIGGVKVTQTIKLGKKVQGTQHAINVSKTSLETTQNPFAGASGAVQGHKTRLSLKKSTYPTKETTQKSAVSMKIANQSDVKMNKFTQTTFPATESTVKFPGPLEKFAQSVKVSQQASIIKLGKSTTQPKKLILGTGKSSSKTKKVGTTPPAGIDQQSQKHASGATLPYLKPASASVVEFGGLKTVQTQKATVSAGKGQLIRISQRPIESLPLKLTKATMEGSTTPKSSPRNIQRLTGKFIGGVKVTQTVKYEKKVSPTEENLQISSKSAKSTVYALKEVKVDTPIQYQTLENIVSPTAKLTKLEVSPKASVKLEKSTPESYEPTMQFSQPMGMLKVEKSTFQPVKSTYSLENKSITVGQELQNLNVESVKVTMQGQNFTATLEEKIPSKSTDSSKKLDSTVVKSTQPCNTTAKSVTSSDDAEKLAGSTKVGQTERFTSKNVENPEKVYSTPKYEPTSEISIKLIAKQQMAVVEENVPLQAADLGGRAKTTEAPQKRPATASESIKEISNVPKSFTVAQAYDIGSKVPEKSVKDGKQETLLTGVVTETVTSMKNDTGLKSTVRPKESMEPGFKISESSIVGQPSKVPEKSVKAAVQETPATGAVPEIGGGTKDVASQKFTGKPKGSMRPGLKVSESSVVLQASKVPEKSVKAAVQESSATGAVTQAAGGTKNVARQKFTGKPKGSMKPGSKVLESTIVGQASKVPEKSVEAGVQETLATESKRPGLKVSESNTVGQASKVPEKSVTVAVQETPTSGAVTPAISSTKTVASQKFAGRSKGTKKPGLEVSESTIVGQASKLPEKSVKAAVQETPATGAVTEAVRGTKTVGSHKFTARPNGSMRPGSKVSGSTIVGQPPKGSEKNVKAAVQETPASGAVTQAVRGTKIIARRKFTGKPKGSMKPGFEVSESTIVGQPSKVPEKSVNAAMQETPATGAVTQAVGGTKIIASHKFTGKLKGSMKPGFEVSESTIVGQASKVPEKSVKAAVQETPASMKPGSKVSESTIVVQASKVPEKSVKAAAQETPATGSVTQAVGGTMIIASRKFTGKPKGSMKPGFKVSESTIVGQASKVPEKSVKAAVQETPATGAVTQAVGGTKIIASHKFTGKPKGSMKPGFKVSESTIIGQAPQIPEKSIKAAVQETPVVKASIKPYSKASRFTTGGARSKIPQKSIKVGLQETPTKLEVVHVNTASVDNVTVTPRSSIKVDYGAISPSAQTQMVQETPTTDLSGSVVTTSKPCDSKPITPAKCEQAKPCDEKSSQKKNVKIVFEEEPLEISLVELIPQIEIVDQNRATEKKSAIDEENAKENGAVVPYEKNQIRPDEATTKNISQEKNKTLTNNYSGIEILIKQGKVKIVEKPQNIRIKIDSNLENPKILGVSLDPKGEKFVLPRVQFANNYPQKEKECDKDKKKSQPDQVEEYEKQELIRKSIDMAQYLDSKNGQNGKVSDMTHEYQRSSYPIPESK